MSAMVVPVGKHSMAKAFSADGSEVSPGAVNVNRAVDFSTVVAAVERSTWVMPGTAPKTSSDACNKAKWTVSHPNEELHQRLPYTRILLLEIFPRGAQPNPAREKVAEVNTIAKLDGDLNVTYLDLGKVFLEPDGTVSPEVMNDYLHPTAAGYERWASAMEPTLRKLLGPTFRPHRLLDSEQIAQGLNPRLPLPDGRGSVRG